MVERKEVTILCTVSGGARHLPAHSASCRGRYFCEAWGISAGFRGQQASVQHVTEPQTPMFTLPPELLMETQQAVLGFPARGEQTPQNNTPSRCPAPRWSQGGAGHGPGTVPSARERVPSEVQSRR